MNIEEVIEDFRRSAKTSKRMAESLPDSYDRFIGIATDDDQIADWLEDYKSLKNSLSGNAYQRMAERTIDRNLKVVDVEYHALHGMVGEIGEIHSIFQKEYQGHDIEEEHLKKEVGDLLWFIAEFCSANSWELEEIMRMNIKKLEERYPEGFEVEKSLHRREGDI